MRIEVDYLVMGSGVAGLFFAIQAAEHGRVAVVAKRDRSESNTRYAQGGIAAVMDEADSVAQHARVRSQPVRAYAAHRSSSP